MERKLNEKKMEEEREENNKKKRKVFSGHILPALMMTLE